MQNQLEIIVGTIAVLFVPPEPWPVVDSTALENDLGLRRPLSVGQTVSGLTVISSNRDQVELQLGSNKLDVRSSSDDLNHIKEKVPESLAKFLNLMGNPTLQSYGVNFILETQHSDADKWLGDKFLNRQLAKIYGTDVYGVGVGLRLNRPPKTIILRIESRNNSLIHVNLNVSESSESLPDIQTLSEELQKEYDELLTLLEKFQE